MDERDAGREPLDPTLADQARLWDILRRPRITEKGTLLAEHNKYVFQVTPAATKLDIKRAVEQAFKVNVVKVNTMNMRGKERRWGRRYGRMPDWKKAVVTLQPGQKIELFTGV